MQTITFNNTELHLVEDTQHEFLLTNKDVALGFGTTIQSLTQAKKNNQDELIEGKHFIKLEVQTKGGKQKVIHWTKRGIVRLGFFIKSEKAKAFRDWAEDYITNPHAEINPEIEKYKNTILAQNACIAKLYNELQAKPKQLPHAEINPEIEELKKTLIRVHDGYHKILTTCSPIDMQKELSKMTCLFQHIKSTHDKNLNLNTQTIARHSYWK